MFTNPRPLTLGLNSLQPRSAEMTVDQRLAVRSRRCRACTSRRRRRRAGVRIGHRRSVGEPKLVEASPSRLSRCTPRLASRDGQRGRTRIRHAVYSTPVRSGFAYARGMPVTTPHRDASTRRRRVPRGRAPRRLPAEPRRRRGRAGRAARARPGCRRLGAPDWVNYDFADFVANIAFFIPIGLSRRCCCRGGCGGWRSRSALRSRQCSSSASTLFLPERYASSTDVAANTAGAVVGALIGAGIRAIRMRTVAGQPRQTSAG